jgi:putative transposase
MIIKAYKFRIYPNIAQQNMLKDMFGTARFSYNMFLQHVKDIYSYDGTYCSAYDLNVFSAKMRNDSRFSFLKQMDATAMQCEAESVSKAFDAFFKKRSGFPKFHSEKRDKKSYTTKCVNNNIRINHNLIKLPKLRYVKAKISQNISGKIATATVSEDSTNQYFVSIICKNCDIEQYPNIDKSVGIDLGIKDEAICSDGTVCHQNKYYKNIDKKVKRIQRALARRSKSSKRYAKQRVKLAKLEKHIANKRNDYIQKITTKIVKNNNIVCIEDLNASGMMKNHKLSRSVVNSSFRNFRTVLAYKCEWHNRILSVLDRFYPSSQLCSVCGYKNPNTKDLSVREWDCPVCHTRHNRDLNAAKNILTEGLRQLNSTK